jgi:aromatic-L-amino-acid decarboxylase
MAAPTTMNIVGFRYPLPGATEEEQNGINTKMILHLQEEGLAVLPDTTIQRKHCLRAAIANHRTTGIDLALLVRETV